MPLLPVSELEKLSPVFRGKAGRLLGEAARRLFAVASLSDKYDRVSRFRGVDFAAAMLDELEVTCAVDGAGRLDRLPEGPFVTVSNHPYGGVDGLVLLRLIGERRPDFKVMVNEFLAYVEALRPALILVNPTTDARRGVTDRNIQGVKEVISRLSDGHPVGFFPSGAVSDLSLRGWSIRDRQWQEPLLRLLQKVKVPIVPVKFHDRNSLFFYLLGLVDWRLRTLRLPRELTNKQGRTLRVGIGETLSVEEQLRHPDVADFGRWLRESVYGIPLK